MKSAKGGEFERDICKLISLWWSNQDRNDLFWRTSQSGGRATTRRQKGIKQTAGGVADMMATNEVGRPLTRACVFEMKRGYSDKYKIVTSKKTGKQSVKKTKYGIDMLSILDKLDVSKEPVLIDWWRKLEKERIATRRNFSFIIFRRDAKQSCIVMNKKTYDFIESTGEINTYREIRLYFNMLDDLSSLVIMKLDDFLLWVQPKCFLNIPRPIKRRVKLKKRKIKRRSPKK